jgi:hypothetical protein
MRIDPEGKMCHGITLGCEIETPIWRGKVMVAELIGVATDGEIEPVKYDVFRLDVYVRQTQG